MLGLAIAMNPIGLLVTGLTTAITAAYIFRQELAAIFANLFQVMIPNMLVDLDSYYLLKSNGQFGAMIANFFKSAVNVAISAVNKLTSVLPQKLKNKLGLGEIALLEMEDIVSGEQEALQKIDEIKKRMAERAVTQTMCRKCPAY